MASFVDRLEVENFFCVKKVDIALRPFHAFIGPNDSGKSTLLRAVWGLASMGGGIPFVGPTRFTWPSSPWRVRMSKITGWFLESSSSDGTKRPTVGGPLVGAQLVRFEPDALRESSALIPHGELVTFTDTRGRGLAAVLDAMLSRHPEQFIQLRSRFVELFPDVERVEIQNDANQRKVIGATLTTGQQIGPSEMSDGMLYWLGFRALQYASKPTMLLLEEPENGLHPARIREVMGLLREISKGTQVLIATHSPLVVNELDPDEVTIITRTAEEGTRATPMRATKNFAQRSKVYALGELWLSYADGNVERELVGPDDPKDAKAAG